MTNDLRLPIYSVIQHPSVDCRDDDHDGYYNWGTGSEQPTSCAAAPPINDCNDWDPRLALQKDDGSCVPACTVTINQLVAQPNALWPPNHEMVPVRFAATASDTRGGKPACRVVAIASNEAAADPARPDSHIVDDLLVKLRATRGGSGPGRAYTISVRCADALGNAATGTTTVAVPHDQGRDH